MPLDEVQDHVGEEVGPHAAGVGLVQPPLQEEVLQEEQQGPHLRELLQARAGEPRGVEAVLLVEDHVGSEPGGLGAELHDGHLRGLDDLEPADLALPEHVVGQYLHRGGGLARDVQHGDVDVPVRQAEAREEGTEDADLAVRPEGPAGVPDGPHPLPPRDHLLACVLHELREVEQLLVEPEYGVLEVGAHNEPRRLVFTDAGLGVAGLRRCAGHELLGRDLLHVLQLPPPEHGPHLQVPLGLLRVLLGVLLGEGRVLIPEPAENPRALIRGRRLQGIIS
mmetsp:Transcript_89878/g.254695  ORF Transcript_89878/g.254695 Transcript_89878/m.254695 type:complete len:279 (+) Transcript_89878:695-1531(+)